jgi:hypothetical protein
MAAYEGPGQSEATNGALTEDFKSDDEIDDLSGSKSFYMVPMSFVIHTYSRVRPDSFIDSNEALSTQFSPYRHKVTMFKVFFYVAVKKWQILAMQFCHLYCYFYPLQSIAANTIIRLKQCGVSSSPESPYGCYFSHFVLIF